MEMPSLSAIGKAVIITAVSLVVINFIKPYAPYSVRKFLG